MIKIKQFSKPIILILITIFLYISPNLINTNYNIGILPVDNISKNEINTIKSGFKLNQNYNKYFKPIILNETLNSSYIKQEKGFLLNDDFLQYNQTNNLKQKYNLDFLLIVTDKQIKDFNKGGYGVWGQADSKTESVLMTTHYFGNDKLILPHIAQHEIFHLFGYLHNPIETNGIMQYKNLEQNKLSKYYQVQLPIKTIIKQFISNNNFSINYFLINLILIIFIYPLFLGLNKILQISLKIKENKKINHAATILGLFILFCMNYGYLVFYISLFLSLSTNYFLNFRK